VRTSVGSPSRLTCSRTCFEKFLLIWDALVRINNILEGFDDLPHRIENTHGSLHYIGDFLPAQITPELFLGNMQHIDIIGPRMIVNAPEFTF